MSTLSTSTRERGKRPAEAGEPFRFASPASKRRMLIIVNPYATTVSDRLRNLVVYALLLGLGAHTAAAISFVISAANNYWWNRHWTFADTKGHFGYQGIRFFVVSGVSFAANQLWLFVFLDWLGLGKITSQAIAIALSMPLNFLGNKLWSFRA